MVERLSPKMRSEMSFTMIPGSSIAQYHVGAPQQHCSCTTQICSDVRRVCDGVLRVVPALVFLGFPGHRADCVHPAHYLLRLPADPPHTRYIAVHPRLYIPTNESCHVLIKSR